MEKEKERKGRRGTWGRARWRADSRERFHFRAVFWITMSKKKPECLQSHALNVPWVQTLKGKRVVLASASPRRREILAIFVRPLTSLQYIHPSHSSERDWTQTSSPQPSRKISVCRSLRTFTNIQSPPPPTREWRFIDVWWYDPASPPTSKSKNRLLVRNKTQMTLQTWLSQVWCKRILINDWAS